MCRLILLLLIIGFGWSPLFAQKRATAILRGHVTDSSSAAPLESATINVIEIKDSTLFNYTLSDAKGDFVLRNVPVETPFRIVVSFNGYRSMVKMFSIAKDQKEFILTGIQLIKSYTELEEVIVTAEKPPIVFRKDTIEFNAGSFKTKTNAVVEDLLKQLPGFEVDKDGTITINGKPVSKITVDGRAFFANDPLLATRNLPKDIVDKIQVSDNKSKEAIFNKTTDGNEDKAINITLKKDKKRGWFGRAGAGYGSQQRYEAGASINYFKGKNQINFIGSLNNTNRMNFGRGNNRGGGGNNNGPGITESGSAGLNLNTEIGKKLRINGSYFYNDGTTLNKGRRKRENILPDTSFYYIAQNDNVNRGQGHQFALNGDSQVDSLTNVNFQLGYSQRTGRSSSSNSSVSQSLNGTLINSSNTNYISNPTDNGFNGNVFVSRRLNQKGRGVTLSAGYSRNNAEVRNSNIGLNTFNRGGSLETDSLNQRGYDDNSNNNYSVSFSWSEPITKTLAIIPRIGYSQANSISDRSTFRLNNTTGKYDLADSLLTNSFKNDNESITPGIMLNYNGKQLRGNVGSSINFLKQDNYSLTKDSLLRQRYENMFPTANVSYQLNKTTNISINYNGNTQQPSIQQLQPVADNRNPLYIRLGNPDLQPSFSHNVNINFNGQKIERKIFMYGAVNYRTTNNQIVQEVYYDSVGRQISRPINTDGNYNGSIQASYGKEWRNKIWRLRINSGSSVNHGKNTVFSNKIRNLAKSYGWSESLSVNFERNDIFELTARYNYRFNDTKYSIEQKGQVSSNVTQTFSFDVDLDITKRISLESDLNTNYNSRITPGFRKSVTNWNASLNWKLFAKEQGTIRIVMYDILKQNTSVYRTISPTYIEDVEQEVLQRYFLVSFTYNLKKFGR
jgi:outer membrane beta-barrel protein/carboxypeptidase-like protein